MKREIFISPSFLVARLPETLPFCPRNRDLIDSLRYGRSRSLNTRALALVCVWTPNPSGVWCGEREGSRKLGHFALEMGHLIDSAR